MDYELNVTQQEFNLIIQSLGELPMKLTLNLFLKLQEQVRVQSVTQVANSPEGSGNERRP